MDTEDSKPAARPSSPSTKRDKEQAATNTKHNKSSPPPVAAAASGADTVEQKRQQIQKAIGMGDYGLVNRLLQELSGFQLPEAREWKNLTTCARLGRDFLDNQGLKDYVNAADACLEEDPSPTLGTISELLKLQDTREDGIGCFAAIFASSGTGKTQLAATASMDTTVRSKATVLYVNLSPAGSQDFYRPHEVLGLHLIEAFKLFRAELGKIYSKSPSTICKWNGRETNDAIWFYALPLVQ